MNEFPENLLKNTPDINSPEYKAFEIRRRAHSVFRRYVEKIWENSPKDNLIPTFIRMIKRNISNIVPEAKEGSQEIDKAIKSLQEKDKEDLIDRAVEITIQIVAKHLSLEELERRLREKILTQPEIYELSKVLLFKIDKKNEKITIHVPTTFLKDSKSVLESFKEGLKALADKIATNTELKDIKEIRGFSSLIKDHHRLLTSLGFSVTFDKTDKPTEEAKMSKEKLLELYGPKSTP